MRASMMRRPLVVLMALLGVVGPSWAGVGETSTPNRVSEGRVLFLTDWTAAGREASRGDGLGPVFNERSCVACHGQGGVGGAGGSRVDVMILTDAGSKRLPDGSIEPSVKLQSSDVYPGLAAGPSLVIHRFATDPGYDGWRLNVLKCFGEGSKGGEKVAGSEFKVAASFRNTPALFGDGLIDAVPGSVLEAVSRRQNSPQENSQFPEIKGHPSRLKDGRIGRFGWKAQTASLDDFVRIACANELGLENPGHSQPSDPLRPNYKPPGLDLTDADCKALTAFIAALPQPVESRGTGLPKSERIQDGRDAFIRIGCAECHMPELGDVEGIYSDLLLHDMGEMLGDSGHSYGSRSSPVTDKDAPKEGEWRTPPLWGLRDSAPYLHDGRAATITRAIKLHAGEGQNSASRYRELAPRMRQNLDLFLQSLAAPSQPDNGKKAKKR
jgi:CxxC motif-containing protein (DUF1111 family)